MANKKPTVAFYGLWPEMHKRVQIALKQFPVKLYTESLNEKNSDGSAEILAVFIESPVTTKILEHFPKLKLVVTMSTGFDHIDLKACAKKDIQVANVPTYGENTVAEHTMALILGLTRKLFLSVKRVKEGVYDFEGLRGVDLKGKTLGVVGTGRIGQHVIRMAKAFEMQVVAFDLFPNKKAAKELGFKYATLDTVLGSSNIVTLHTPLTKKTTHLINKKTIYKMKVGSYLINTSRGALIDPEALVVALQKNHLAGAGLDVLEDESLIQNEEKLISGCTDYQIKTSLMNNIIIDHPNTIVTPHNAFNSTESIGRIIDTTIHNIKSYIKGTPENII